MDKLGLGGFAIRVIFSLFLVLLTFNPSGLSYYHWVADTFPKIQPLQAVAGVLLLILWIFLWRSMMQALGSLGVLLMAALTAALIWLVASWGWLDVHNARSMTWIVLVAVALILGIGMSWAIVRRQLTGQASVDELSDND